MTKKIIMMGALLFASILHSQNSIPKEKIAKMIRVMGSSENFEVIMETLIEQQRDNYLFLDSDDFYDRLKEKIIADGYNEIVDLLIPIYQKHLTEVEVDAIITFYESDAGKSFVQKFPLISQESMLAGQVWGKKLAQSITTSIMQSKKVLFEKDNSSCSNFKEGKYLYFLQDGTEVLIQRDGELLQKEIYDSHIITSKIEWISDCRYKLWELDENLQKIDDNPVEVNIIDFSEKSYKFISHKTGEEFYSEGEIMVKTN